MDPVFQTLGFFAVVGLLWLGLLLLSARWPAWEPVFQGYVQLLKLTVALIRYVLARTTHVAFRYARALVTKR